MILILMGVSGSGKTTVGMLLAAKLGVEFCDADDLHPPANLEKMAKNIPLTDDDRKPWLDAVRRFIADRVAQSKDAVVACSALKEEYRESLRVGAETRFIYLKGEYGLITERMARRQKHFMKPAMLQSQFDTLEEPVDSLVVDVSLPPEKIVDVIIGKLATTE